MKLPAVEISDPRHLQKIRTSASILQEINHATSGIIKPKPGCIAGGPSCPIFQPSTKFANSPPVLSLTRSQELASGGETGKMSRYIFTYSPYPNF